MNDSASGTVPSPPDRIAVAPLSGPLQAVVRAPGSKSLTNRALPIAAVAKGRSTLTNVLDSEDTHCMADSLRRLGVKLAFDAQRGAAVVDGSAGPFPAAEAELFVGNSGTTVRFLAAMVAASKGVYVFDGVQRMRERPIGDLLSALRDVGVKAESIGGTGCPPIRIESHGLVGGVVRVRGDVSSQFLSGLLMASPLAAGELEIVVEGNLVSKPYVEMTLAVMRAFGANVDSFDGNRFRCAAPAGYQAAEYAIEPDASSAGYFFAAAAIAGGEVVVEGLGSGSLQGDLRFVDVLARMGCAVEIESGRTRVRSGPLRGIDVDMNAISDMVMTAAVVACFADGPTRIRNVAHIRHKESDRISAAAKELRRAGVEVIEFDDGLEIRPAPLHPAEFDTYNDHRMAMSLALLGLRQRGIVIRDPACTAKTYPQFWRDLASL